MKYKIEYNAIESTVVEAPTREEAINLFEDKCKDLQRKILNVGEYIEAKTTIDDNVSAEDVANESDPENEEEPEKEEEVQEEPVKKLHGDTNN